MKSRDRKINKQAFLDPFGGAKRRSELALSGVEGVNPCLPAGRLSPQAEGKPQHLCWEVEGLTFLIPYDKNL